MSSADDLANDPARRALDALRAARKRVEQVLRGGAPDAEAATDFDVAVALRKKNAIEREIEVLEKRLSSITADAAAAGAEEAVRETRAQVGATAAGLAEIGVDANVLAYAQESAADQVVAVSDDMKAGLRKSITQALAGGLTQRELEQEISDILDDDGSRARVERIVRTELGRALEQTKAAHDEDLADLGVDFIKVWVASHDSRTRPDHAAIDGQERELDEPFHLGGGATAGTSPADAPAGAYEANAPLDPSLPPEEAINCRCTVVRRNRSEAKQSYIAQTRSSPQTAKAESQSAAGSSRT